MNQPLIEVLAGNEGPAFVPVTILAVAFYMVYLLYSHIAKQSNPKAYIKLSKADCIKPTGSGQEEGEQLSKLQEKSKGQNRINSAQASAKVQNQDSFDGPGYTFGQQSSHNRYDEQQFDRMNSRQGGSIRTYYTDSYDAGMSYGNQYNTIDEQPYEDYFEQNGDDSNYSQNGGQYEVDKEESSEEKAIRKAGQRRRCKQLLKVRAAQRARDIQECHNRPLVYISAKQFQKMTEAKQLREKLKIIQAKQLQEKLRKQQEPKNNLSGKAQSSNKQKQAELAEQSKLFHTPNINQNQNSSCQSFRSEKKRTTIELQMEQIKEKRMNSETQNRMATDNLINPNLEKTITSVGLLGFFDTQSNANSLRFENKQKQINFRQADKVQNRPFFQGLAFPSEQQKNPSKQMNLFTNQATLKQSKKETQTKKTYSTMQSVGTAPQQLTQKFVPRSSLLADRIPNQANSGGAISNINLNLSPQQYMETIIKFAQAQQQVAEIQTKMNNLGGARSSLNELWIETKSFLDSFDKSNDQQLTTFALKMFSSICFTLIRNTNVKNGIERMPPKLKTDQVQKNQINKFILMTNLYRMMGYQKIWLIVFGKTLKLLEFIYKRKGDLDSHKKLDLVANNYIQLKGEFNAKYLSKVDYLTYFLFGLALINPIDIFSQVAEKDPETQHSLRELLNYKFKWSYREFWLLFDCVAKNKHQSYFKPIIYLNLFGLLYPLVRKNKASRTEEAEFVHIYTYILRESKLFFDGFERNTELRVLRDEDSESRAYDYEGDEFVGMLKVLKNRVVEKENEFKITNLRQFQEKASILYYFTKDK